MGRSRGWRWGRVWAVLALLGVGCGSENPGGNPADGSKPGVGPDVGATEFVSADSSSGAQGGPGSLTGGKAERASADNAAPPVGTPTAGMTGGAQRSVERGDIFRLLPDGRILNLNAYRGVQIIDIRDPNAPRVEGRLAVAGQPVELYLAGDRAIVLLNDWRGYYGSRDDVRVESVEGGLVMSVDISDRAHPRLIDQAPVRGSIQTSRLTQGGSQTALYVAAQYYEVMTQQFGPRGGVGIATSGGSKTVLKSFDVSSGTLVAKSELDLGGYVQDVQATTDVMMVASVDYNRSQPASRVALVDISSPDGSMVLGDEIATAGIVQNKFNMDIWNGVLRIASGSNWNGTTNHLETFDVRNLADALPLAHCSFGSTQNLFATLFLRDKAFFVTYLRQDPFHVFTIDEQGQCAERSEFVVSGWNTFFRAVMDETRLIGIGQNDENRQNQLAVSLYDITDVLNPNPLLARAQIDLNWAYSEGTGDDRAFTVLEDAVSIAAADGTEETGLVLLPFAGYDQGATKYQTGVQIFTFSDHTLTARGTMDHGTPVRRSFEASADTTANLSEEQMSLFDTSDPANPAELGRVDLAPNFQQVLIYGDYVARVRDRAGYYYASNETLPDTTVEILPRGEDLEGAAAVATLNVTAGSELVQVGDLLVTLLTRYVPNASGKETYQTDIKVYDLADPTAPREGGTLSTDRLQPYYGGGYYGGRGITPPAAGVADCFDCGRYGGYYRGYGTSRTVVPGGIVFPQTQAQQKSIGWFEDCYESPMNQGCTVAANGVETTCPTEYYAGGISCRTPRGTNDRACSGEFYVCNTETGECEPGRPPLGTQRNCYTSEQFRYWSSYSFEVLDLRDANHPVLGTAIDMPDDEEGTSVIAVGDSVYFSYQKPIDLANDARPFVRRYVRQLDLSDVGHPVASAGINVPGEVIAAEGDTLYTRDLVWDESHSETLIARLQRDGGVARLQAQRLFDGRAVSSVQLDGSGHVLVSHDPAWVNYWSASDEPQPHRLSILDADSLSVAGETDIDSWATFVTAKDGRALFSVAGGVLVVNVADAEHPFAQAYFPTPSGWSSELLLDGNEILYAAGPYGVYRLDAKAFNLLTR